MFALVGRVVAEWAQFEHILDMTIWSIVNYDQATLACITSQIMGARPRCLVIAALVERHQLPKKFKGQVEKLSGRSSNYNEQRNRFAHDAWFMETESRAVGRFKKMPRGDLVFGIQEQDRKKILDLIQGVQDLQKEASQLRDDILSALTPSLDKP